MIFSNHVDLNNHKISSLLSDSDFDSCYGSIWFGKIKCLLTKKGKKQTAGTYLSNMFKKFKLEYGLHPFVLLLEYLMSNKISVELRSFRKSSVFYDVPFPVKNKRQIFKSFRLLLSVVYKNTNSLFRIYVYTEINKFVHCTISALEKYNEEVSTSAAKNRAYQQYRW